MAKMESSITKQDMSFRHSNLTGRLKMKKSISISILLALLAAVVLAQAQKSAPGANTQTQQKNREPITKPIPKPDQKQNPKQQPKKDEEILTSDETVRLGADLVNLFFSAVDRSNRALSDIQKEDVTIL